MSRVSPPVSLLAAAGAAVLLSACGSSAGTAPVATTTAVVTPIPSQTPAPSPVSGPVPTPSSKPKADPRFDALTVKDPQQSAGFIDASDLDGDGRKEILLTTLIEQSPPGPPTAASRGALRVFSMGPKGLDGPWTEKVLISTTDPQGEAFINTPQVMDVDEDGIKDIVVHTGFLTTLGGSHFWLKGPSFTTRTPFATETTRNHTLFFWHESSQVDLDGDGKKDIVTTSVQTQDPTGNPLNPTGKADGKEHLSIEWYRHLGKGVFEYHQILGGLGSAGGLGGVFLKTRDIDGDGDPDIVVSQFFGPPARPSLLWLEMQKPPSAANNWQGVFVPHPIDQTIGLGYHFEFADLDRDGRDELVVGAHNNQNDTRLKDAAGNTIFPGIYAFTIPTDPRTATAWPKKVISQAFRVTLDDMGNPASQGTPGIFSVGDVTGDGRPDIAVPGDGNSLLYLFRQLPDGSFVEQHLEDKEKEFGMTLVTDLDGDGKNEIVAAKHNSNDGGTTLPPGFLRVYRLKS